MGWLAICLYKERHNDYGDITFVIPDKLIEAAKDALADTYHLCTDSNCMEHDENRQDHRSYCYGPRQLEVHPKPVYHFHGRPDEIIYLIPKSDLLWWLPDIPLPLPGPKNPDLTVSTDPNLPCPAPWLGKHPVRVLKPASFVEALLWLWMRDFWKPPPQPSAPFPRLWLAWDSMAVSMRVDWDDDPAVPNFQKVLREEFQPAWDYFCGRYPKSVKRFRNIGNFSPHRLGLLYLRERLNKEGRFLSELIKIDLPEVAELKDQ